MINKINKKGFTLAEALIAMLLVAVLAAGIITALMATKRAIISPGNREDMIMAIEEASALLQKEGAAIDTIAASQKLTETPSCKFETARNQCHNINGLIPKSCQAEGDYFVYKVSSFINDQGQNQKVVTFKIQCEGQSI